MAFAEELRALGQRLLDPAMRADAAFLGRILASDFLEIGQSGRKYDQPTIIKELKAEPGLAGPHTIVDFEAREAGPGLVLAVYRIAETGTARSSLWRRTTTWKLVFHQGTPSVQL